MAAVLRIASTGLCLAGWLFAGMAVSASTDAPPPSSSGSESVATEAADPDADDFQSRWKSEQLALFDHLRADPSSRMQVLSADLYLSDDDLPLRPKVGEVMARAVPMAPDDTFVQWRAANAGNYWNSSCGPVERPEAEVANLIRLESDNAAAWVYAVALASAIGDQDGVDSALSRLAVAPRADDHFIELWRMWTSVYKAMPDLVKASPFASATDAPNAEFAAYMRARGGTGSAAQSLRTVCTIDAGERTWQRLGWCADAGRKLAADGGSLALREEGLELLAAIGDRSEETARSRRQLDWLSDHAITPDMRTDAASTSSDWDGARTQVEAIERRLARLGEPLQAPEAWTSSKQAEEAEFSARTESRAEYWRTLATAMKADPDARVQALAASMAPMFAVMSAGGPASADKDGAGGSQELAALVAKHPDDVVIQWLAASSRSPPDPVAMANLQRLEPDNAAVWALALGDATESAAISTGDALRRMASATRFDFHYAELTTVWLDVLRRTPPPASVMSDWMEDEAVPVAELAIKKIALGMATAGFGSTPLHLLQACSTKAIEEPVRKADCVAVGRRFLHSDGTLLFAMIGGQVLKQADAVDAADRLRMRSLAWLAEVLRDSFAAGRFDAMMIEDASSGLPEIEAMRRAAEHAGKLDPPADWNPPGG